MHPQVDAAAGHVSDSPPLAQIVNAVLPSHTLDHVYTGAHHEVPNIRRSRIRYEPRSLAGRVKTWSISTAGFFCVLS